MSVESEPFRSRGFERYSWFVLAYTIGVILFGAWVRITGSGAGCGEHWPTCHGDVVPRPEQIETVIEFTHRLTSGLSLLLVVGLLVWSRRFPVGHLVRRAGLLSFFFICVEALLGAGLVLFGLVGDDDSVARAVSMSLHLANTMVLTSVLLLAVHGARGARFRLARMPSLATFGAIVLVVVSLTGAVTALGDTLFPVSGDELMGFWSRFNEQGSDHFLKQLRAVHPVLAVVAAVGVINLVSIGFSWTRDSMLVCGAVLLQVCVGVVNVMLSAPGWMQIVHLFTGELLWLTYMWWAFRLTDGAMAPQATSSRSDLRDGASQSEAVDG